MQKWLDAMEHMLLFVDDSDFRDELMECHQPRWAPSPSTTTCSTIDRFDARDRIHSLKAPLTLDPWRRRPHAARRIRA